MKLGIEATPQPIGLFTLRKDLRKVIETVIYRQTHYVLMRHGEEVAVLMSVDAYRRLVAAYEARDAATKPGGASP